MTRPVRFRKRGAPAADDGAASGGRAGPAGGAGAPDVTDGANGANARNARNARAGGAKRSWPAVLLRVVVMGVAFAAMVGFAVVLARLTLVPSPASEELVRSNLVPGDSIRQYLDQPQLRDAVKQIGGNVLLGVPFGVLLPVVWPKARGLLRVVLLTALVMVLVETVQGAVVTGRAFDIDDVILNTSGALLGYLLLGRRIGRAVHPPRRRWWQRRTHPAGTA
ncbi:VanZ family protein [Streptomyces sp. NPDC059637]|uniref:VanZ family protein n=1 Tax=Streptomyces sp. NPDC059637 TaxID=3347752 RepID=UPI00367CBE6A